MGTDRGVAERVFDEVAAAEGLPPRAGELALAAVMGADDLAAALAGEVTLEPPEPAPAAVDPPAMFLSDITVTGFRGISAPATLKLTPGPGLTLVVGRNGSGKSSFADAAELALTGTTARWDAKSVQWKDGWRNLHHDGARAVLVRLATEGQDGATKIARSWQAGEPLTGGEATAQRPGEAQVPVADLGLADAMQTYRPFLPYSELSGLLEDGPSKLFDAVSGVLGLGELTDAVARLTEARKKAEATVTAAKGELTSLKTELGSVDDDRARDVLALLKPRTPDLDALAAVATGVADAPAAVEGLEALAALRAPAADAVTAAVTALRDAMAAADAVRGTDAERAA